MLEPRDLYRFSRYIFDGTAQYKEYTDITNVTEYWGLESGQTKFRSIPKMINNSFTYDHIYFNNDLLIPHPPEDWQGTNFNFLNSDVSRITATIHNHDDSQVVKVLFTDKLYLPGEIDVQWNGYDSSGEKYDRCNYYIRIRFESIYGYPNHYTRLFNISIPCGGSLAAKEDGSLVDGVKLFPNYPNPFNNTTTFKFLVPERAKVEIKMYNVLGQFVSTLVDGTFKSGSHSIKWDGLDDNGNVLASGIYIYSIRFTINKKSKLFNQKLLLVK